MDEVVGDLGQTDRGTGLRAMEEPGTRPTALHAHAISLHPHEALLRWETLSLLLQRKQREVQGGHMPEPGLEPGHVCQTSYCFSRWLWLSKH